MAERGNRFLLLFGLANAGGVVAYVPFLTLLLPAKIALLAGDARIEWLGALTLAGALAASAGNIAFGWASDLFGTRRRWATAGLCLTILSYAFLHAASTAPQVLAAIIFYQLALNMLLSPLVAWAADVVPDRRKGLLGGLTGAGPPIGALAGVAATMPFLTQEWMRLSVVCLIVCLLTAPLLLSRPEPFDDAPAPATQQQRPRGARTDFALLWAARLLVQVAGNLMFAFLLYYFSSLSDAPSQADVARLTAIALLVAFPIALASGRLSDRVGRRRPFVAAAAGVAAIGLGVMATQTHFVAAAVGYALFACAGSVFLALHSGYSMQLLPSPGRRGRDLGVLNLANTLPAIIAPVLAVSVVPGSGFGPLLMVLAALIALGGVAVLLVSRDEPGGHQSSAR